MRHSQLLAALLATLLATACGGAEANGPLQEPGPDDALAGDDLPLGEVEEDSKADGFGSALTCKPVPELSRLVAPKIVVSLEGLTLHLTDAATGYDRIFPIGPGAIDTDETSLTYGESLSYQPVLAKGTQDFEIRPSTIQECKTWWRDPASGSRTPVFAGLPFLSWSGNYAIHGPIDSYTSPNGGNLRRGFVSHGCIRMAAADVLELYGRIRGVARVPVHVQREAEKLPGGRRADIANKWLGAECAADSECNFGGGVCHLNPYSTTGFCTMACSRACPDLAGQPTSFCVADPQSPSAGICVPQDQAMSRGCAAFDHFVPRTLPRFNQTARTAAVCVPGSPGFIGDHCLGEGECDEGLSCEGAAEGAPGICTQPCARACPDEPGYAWTACAADPELGNSCLRRCTTASNESECPADMACEQRARPGSPSTLRDVCVLQ